MPDVDLSLRPPRPGARRALAALCLLAFAYTSAAQPGVIRGFGDSLLDTGRVCARTGFPSGDYGTCSNGKGTLQWLPDYAPLVFDRSTNLAEGGAGTGAFNVASLIVPDAAGAATQVQRFVTSGARIGATDLVVYSAGPNNRYLLGPAGPLFGSQYNPALSGEGLAERSLAETHASIGALIDAGGRNVVVFGGRARTVEGSPEQRYMAAMNNGLAQALNGFAGEGVRLRIFDFQSIYLRAITDPQRYGLDEPFLYSDYIHPTEAGHRLFARYIAALIASADAIAAQVDTAEAATHAFSDAVLERLQAVRPVASASQSGFGVYLQPLAVRGERADFFSADGAATGFDYAVDGLLAGIEYRDGAQTRYGATLGYAGADTDLDDSAGTSDTSTTQGSVYLSHDRETLFADAILAYADHEIDIERRGVIDTLVADTGGRSALAGARAGYLFQHGNVRVGPLLTLAYTDTGIDGYSERGDDVLAQRVGDQGLESLEIGAGIRLRAALRLAGCAVEPALDMSLVNDVMADERRLRTANVFAPSLPVYTLIDDDEREDRFARIAAGVGFALTQDLALTLAAKARLPHEGNHEYGVSASLELALP